MYQQRLCRIADAWSLNLGVDDDWDCLLLISARIEVDVTDASAGLDRGDLCFIDDGANQISTPTWDDEIDKAPSMEKGTDRISVIAWDQCDEICAQPRLFDRFPHQRDQDLIRLSSRGGSSQECGIPGGDEDHCRIDGDIWACLIDHPHDAEGHTYLAKVKSILKSPFVQCSAECIRKGCDLSHSGCDRLNTRRR